MRSSPTKYPARFGPALAALALAISAIATPAPALGASKLWVAWTSQNADCRTEDEDFFACLLGATEFNTMAQGYPQGHALAWGGGATVDGCADQDWNCVVSTAHFAVNDDDVVVYLHAGACGGHNSGPHSGLWPTMVNAGGRSVHVRGAELGDDINGTHNCHCHQALGMHEIYEATSESSSGDCCNGQTPDTGDAATNLCEPFCAQCAPTCDRFSSCTQGGLGWYTVACPSGEFRAQMISPSDNEWDPSGCTMLTVDPSALCAQPRAQREPWRCANGNLVRCMVTEEVQDCGGAGCTDAPTPHCNAAGTDAGCAGRDVCAMDTGRDAASPDGAESDAMDAAQESGATMDAGVVAVAGGCGCRAAARGGRGGGTAVAAFLAALCLARARRRRKSKAHAKHSARALSSALDTRSLATPSRHRGRRSS